MNSGRSLRVAYVALAFLLAAARADAALDQTELAGRVQATGAAEVSS